MISSFLCYFFFVFLFFVFFQREDFLSFMQYSMNSCPFLTCRLPPDFDFILNSIPYLSLQCARQDKHPRRNTHTHARYTQEDCGKVASIFNCNANTRQFCYRLSLSLSLSLVRPNGFLLAPCSHAVQADRQTGHRHRLRVFSPISSLWSLGPAGNSRTREIKSFCRS